MSGKTFNFELVMRADVAQAKGSVADLEGALAAVTEASRRNADATVAGNSGTAAAEQATTGLTASLRDQVDAFLAAARGGAEWRADLEAIRARINPLFGAAKELEKAIEDLGLAEAAGAISAREATLAHDGLSRSLTDLREKAAAAGIALDGIAPPVTATSSALQVLIERNAGMARSSDGSVAATLRHGEALDALRARFNPVFAASRQYELSLREIADAERQGAISALEAAAARDRAAQAMAPMAGQMGALGTATQKTTHYAGQLTYQLNDIGVMMASGQNPLMLAMQQGTQVAQVFGDMRNRGLAVGPAISGAFLGMLSPISLATIAVIAFGAAGVQALMSLKAETKSYDDRLSDLSETLGRMRGNLDLLGRVRLGDTFGNLTGDVRALARGMLELDRATELRQLRAVTDEFLDKEIGEGWGQFLIRSIAMGVAAGGGTLPPEALMTPAMSRAANYDRLGVANSYDDFTGRIEGIGKLVDAGNVDAVVRSLLDLQSAMSGGGLVAGMSDEARKLLIELSQAAVKTAEIEAFFNGTARTEFISRQVGQIATGEDRQAELIRAATRHGENSAEVEALRTRHLRDGLAARLEELGLLGDSTEAADARAALEGRISAEAEARVARIDKAGATALDDLTRQQALSETILMHGEASAEVEALREGHARDLYRARLAEQGVVGTLADAAVRLLEAEQGRQRLIRQRAAGRQADGMLADLREERAIAQAIVTHGEGSLRVRELQIAAERRLFAAGLDTLAVSEARRRVLMDEWELTYGLRAPDPFGRVAAEQNALRSHQERMERLRLELRLVGETSVARARALALHDAEVEARRVGGDVGEWRARAGAIADMTRELERQGEAWDRARSAAEGMIDGPVEALMKGDARGALASFGQELAGLWADLALKNPLKNRLLGTDYATIDDIGGLAGFFGRMFGGQPLMPETERTRAVAAQAMTVTTPMVHISTAGLSGLPPAAGLAPAANMPVAPQVAMMAGPSMAAAHLRDVAAGGALRPDAITSLNGPFAGALSAMIMEAQQLFGAEAVKVTSAFRTVEHQARLWAQALQKYGSEAEANKSVGRPGGSMHNHGMAVDLRYGSPAVQGWFHVNAARYGLGFPMAHEPWHIEPVGARAAAAGQTLPVAQLERLATTADLATGQLGAFGARAETTGHGLASLGSSFAQALQMLGASRGSGGMLAATLLGGVFRGIGLPGFDRGGWTGSGAATDVAGLVHAEEYVFDADATRRIGVANLEAIRRGAMRGYQSGGYVTAGRPAIPAGQRTSGIAAAATAVADRSPHLIEISVSGTGNGEIAAGVEAAIRRAFDEYDRTVFAGRVRMVLEDDWVM